MLRRYTGAALAAAFAATFLSACGHSVVAVPRLVQAPTSRGEVFGFTQGVTGLMPRVKFFTIPTSYSWPEYITNGPDGNLWFTEFYARQIARITPAGKVTEFPLKGTDDVEAIVTGPDHNLWFTEPGANQIGRMTTHGVLTDFQVPGSDPDPRGITVGPDGNIWFAEFNDDHIGRITRTGVITRFALPDRNTSAWEIMTGPDGNLWVTESSSDRIARFNPNTLTFLPAIRLQSGTNPWALALGLDHHVWFTGRASSSIGVVTNRGVREFKDPIYGSYPDDLNLGPDGIFYFTQSLENGIGRFNPSTGKFMQRIVLSSTDIPQSIVKGPDGNMWFTDPSDTPSLNRIGVVLLQ